MKKLTALLLTFILVFALSACGSESKSSDEASAAPGEAASGSSSETPSSNAKKIKVGASSVPHAEILEQVKPILEEKGVELEIVVFDDYVLPNMALDQGDIDANYFQHKPYLEMFNENKGTHLVPVADIHYEPLGIYPGKTDALDAISEGAQIGIPNDGSNEARALYLLEELGLIKVNHEVGYEATPMDITENTKKLEFVEMDADKLPAAIKDLDLAVINGNYAIASGINESVLASEDKGSDAAKTYANVIAVKEGNQESETVKLLLEALADERVKSFISEKYKGSVVAMN